MSSISDYHNILSQQLPTSANPTEILADRFTAWKAIIKGLITYLKDVISVHEENLLQQVRLSQSVASNFPLADGTNIHDVLQTQGQNSNPSTNNTIEEINSIKRFFLPVGSGSVLDVPNLFNEYHKTMGNYTSRTSKELSSSVIPRLEDLRRDLSIKIKEIRNLSTDFRNTISKEAAQTKEELSAFYSAIESTKSTRSGNLQPKQDPFLAKAYLDKQIRKQLLEENYLHEAFVNIQTSGRELEKLVVFEIQNVLKVYARLIGEESQVIFNVLVPKLDSGFVTKPQDVEWDSFIKQNPNNFINLEVVKARKLSDIQYKYINDPLTLEVRSSFLERRSKFFKSYARGWYVLTPTFIHEFKTPDRKRDTVPVMSLSLDDCEVSEHSKKDPVNPKTWHKFVLHTRHNGLIHRGYNLIFRAESYDLMISWYNDIKKLTQLPTPDARARYIAERLQIQKQKSDRYSLQLHSSSDLSLVQQREENNYSRASDKRMSAPPGTRTQGQFSATLGQDESTSVVTPNGVIITSLENDEEVSPNQQQPQPIHQQQQQQQQPQQTQAVQQTQFDSPHQLHQRSFSMQQQPQQQYQTGQYYDSPVGLQRSNSMAVQPVQQVMMQRMVPNSQGSQVMLNRAVSMTQGYRPQNQQVPIPVEGNLNYQLQQQLQQQQQQQQQQYMLVNPGMNGFLAPNEFQNIGPTASNNTFMSVPQHQQQPKTSMTSQSMGYAPQMDGQVINGSGQLSTPFNGAADQMNNQFQQFTVVAPQSQHQLQQQPVNPTSAIVEGASMQEGSGIPEGGIAEGDTVVGDSSGAIADNNTDSNNASGTTAVTDITPKHQMDDSFGTNAVTFVQNNSSFSVN